MKTKSRILISVFALLVAMSLTVGIGSSLKAEAKYSAEYYYPSGTQFVKYMAMYWSSKRSNATNFFNNNGFHLIDCDTTAGTGGDYYIYTGYKYTTNPAESIRALRIDDDGHVANPYTSPVNGINCTWYKVGTAPEPAEGDGTVDLNKGAGGHDLYLYISRDVNAGPPLTEIFILNSSSYHQDGYTGATSFQNVNGVQDINRGAGGNDLSYQYKSVCTTVDSNSLRAAYNNSAAYVNSGNYTQGSRNTLAAARNNAQNNVISVLDSVACSTNSQTDIDNYTNAINSGLNSLQTNVYLNASNNGGTCSTTSAAVTIGTGSTASFNVSGYTATKSGWNFLGWSTNADATSGSKTTVTVGFNQTIYAIFSKTVTGTFYYLNSSGTQTSSVYSTTIYNAATSGTVSHPSPANVSPWTYLGWRNDTSAAAASTSNYTIGSDTSYYAVYNRSAHLNYNANGGSGAPASASVTQYKNSNGAISTALFTVSSTVPTLSTWNFLKWNTAADNSGASYSSGNTVITSTTADPTLYAIYSKDIKASFNFLDASGTAASSVTTKTIITPASSAAFTAPAAVSPSPWTFLGWRNDTTAAAAASVNYTISSDTTYWAVYNRSASLSYNAGAGSGAPGSQSATQYKNAGGSLSAAQYTLSAVRPVRTGWTFRNWNTASDGSGTSYDVSAPLSNPTAGDVILHAIYEINHYNVTFKNEDGTQLGDVQSIAYGSAATAPATPTKAATAQYTYTFGGWDKAFDNITAETVVTATYTAAVNHYDVSFRDEDGTQLGDVQSIAYGSAATAPATPTKAATAQYTYTFGGWDKSFDNITGETVVTATYTAAVNHYNVTFKNEDGTQLGDVQSIAYGSAATAPATPTKAATAQYTYTFAGWDKAFDNITGETVVTATYTASVNHYDVTFKNEDGTVLGDVQSIAYGSAATAPASPNKASDASSHYTFSGWDKTFDNITGDLTVTAVYTSEAHVFTYTYDSANAPTKTEAGHFTASCACGYSANITLPVLNETDYTVSVVPATTESDGSRTFVWRQNAEYGIDVTVVTVIPQIKFDVSFYNEDGAVKLDEQTAKTLKAALDAYAGEIQTKASTAQYDFTFDGWDTTAVDAENGIYTARARFTSEVRSYNVTFRDEDGTVLGDVQSIAYGSAATAPASPTKAATAQYTYTFGGWDKSFDNITAETVVTATYTASVNHYNVTFRDEDGTVLGDVQSIAYGSAATAPATPTKAATAQYTYTFGGWDKSFDNITGETVVTATYTASVNHYDVTFKNEDGTVLGDVQSIAYGSAATAPATPTKAATAQYTYTFGGWDKSFDNITGETVVTATYTASVNHYDVTFRDEDGTVLGDVQSIAYGSAATAPATPTKAATAQYTYTFGGWDKSFDNITGETVVTATYTASVNHYDVTFKNEDGTVLGDVQSIAYGSAATAPATPTKAATAQYTYTFGGWDKAFDNITGETVVTATYTASVNHYDVTFRDEDGTVLGDVQSIAYGSAATAPASPNKASDASSHYTFSGWDKAFDNITGDLTVTAQYKGEAHSFGYSVVKDPFVGSDGSLLGVCGCGYETTVVVPALNDTDYEVVTVPAQHEADGNSTYTWKQNGTYSVSIVVNIVIPASGYDIVYYDADGMVIGTKNVASLPQVPDAYNETPPAKESTVQYDFTFNGWVVTGDGDVWRAVPNYKSVLRRYTVTFVNNDGAFLSTAEFNYGENIVYPGSTPAFVGEDARYMEFTGWSTDGTTVTGTTTATAQYKDTSTKIQRFFDKFIDLIIRIRELLLRITVRHGDTYDVNIWTGGKWK